METNGKALEYIFITFNSEHADVKTILNTKANFLEGANESRVEHIVLGKL